MRFSLFMLGLCALCSLLPMQALRADEVRPLYQLSDDRMLSDKGRHRALPSFSTGVGSSMSFSSWKVGQVSPIATPNAASTSSRIKLYSTGTEALPSDAPLGVRRSNGRDFGTEIGESNTNATDPTSLPLGSSTILVLFALAYAAYLVTKKRLSNTNR